MCRHQLTRSKVVSFYILIGRMQNPFCTATASNPPASCAMPATIGVAASEIGSVVQ
jgi:hypothetical protein